MALKNEGLPVSVWDEWSRADSRYKSGECERKWESFSGSAEPLTGATVFQMAYQRGYKPSEGHELNWDDDISYDGNEPSDEPQESTEQLIRYLEALFKPDEKVAYVMDSFCEDGKYKPGKKGHYDRTASQLTAALSKCRGDIGSVFGDYNKEAGAWIRFNPMDGKGVRNDNVAEFRYALVESDNMDMSEQKRIIEEMKLPVAALIFSGKKSIHAIVHIDAGSREEYRRRVEYLYSACEDAGLNVDAANKNPSRLSRMPGVIRNGKRQELLAVNIGCRSFDDWKDHNESVHDELPDEENLADIWDDMPELAPCLIDGILRQGHKMLIAGPSKAGKSFSLIELCIAVAEGGNWLERKCAQGRVLYVNLELDRASCLHRFRDVYNALGMKPQNMKNIDIWNLRGHSIPLDRLAPRLISRAEKKTYIAVILDPIYKVITGDENSADQMAAFCNQFDKICTELGTAVIYCHHHSKGSQAGKRTMDRASGSGVFARDPDALLDMSELALSDSAVKQLENEAVTKVCCQWLDRFEKADEASQDDMCSEVKMREICRRELPRKSYEAMLEEAEKARLRVQGKTAWRVDGTLREFAKFPPVNLWFDYPVHRIDTSGILNNIAEEESLPSFKKASIKRKQNNENLNEKNRVKFENAVNFCNNGEPPTVKQLAEYLDTKERTIRSWIDKYGYDIDKNTHTIIKSCNE